MNFIEASANGNLEVVKTLIAAGADVNAKDNNGSTALCRAICWGNLEVAEILKQNGAVE